MDCTYLILRSNYRFQDLKWWVKPDVESIVIVMSSFCMHFEGLKFYWQLVNHLTQVTKPIQRQGALKFKCSVLVFSDQRRVQPFQSWPPSNLVLLKSDKRKTSSSKAVPKSLHYHSCWSFLLFLMLVDTLASSPLSSLWVFDLSSLIRWTRAEFL